MSVFDHGDFEHEEVALFANPRAKLRAIVAIHRTGSFGTSGGGCRVWPYRSSEEALTDVLRLSRAMSFKLALLGVPAGGAKAVVIADPGDKTPPLLEALGDAVEHMAGRFVIAQDVGMTPEDLEIVGRRTRYVMRSGSTAAPTARGVLACLREAARRRLGRGDLRGATVAVQGAGAVGYALCELLAEAGARLLVADLDPRRVERAVRELGARAERPESIHAAAADVFAPCALGSVLDHRAISELRCAIVAGSANNQLASDECAGALAARGVLFTPDFIANAGGVLGAAHAQIEGTLLALVRSAFDRAEREHITPYAAAIAEARARLRE